MQPTIPSFSFHSSGKERVSCVYCNGSHSLTICSVVTDYQKCPDVLKNARYHNIFLSFAAKDVTN